MRRKQRVGAPPPIRRKRARVSNAAAGLMAAVVIAAVSYLVFGGSVPFSGTGFVLKAMFTSQTELHIPSPVRIAGVDVGQVTSVQRISSSSDAGVVTMQIDPSGLPVHAGTTAQIRSRIFLEGNFYVDLHPGSPGAATLQSGSTLPAASTSGPVQLDRVLSALNSDSRISLQTLLRGLGGSFNGAATPAQDATQDPSVRGLTAGQALNKSLDYSADAFRASTLVNQALLGLQPHDLGKVVVGNEQVFRGLAASGNALSSLVSTFNATMATFASRQQQLSQTIALLPPLLQNTNSSDSALDASFAPTKAFAAEILPGVRQLDPTIGVALPWIAQTTALMSPAELGGLLKSLTPAVQQTGSTLRSTKTLISAADQLARCFSHNIVPTGNAVIQDPPASTGLRVYQELFQSAVGIAGAAGNFDGNGRYVRASAGGGSVQAATPSLPQNGPLYGNFVLNPLGTRPAYVTNAPPIRRDVPCFQNPAPNLNQVQTGAAP
jgi:phospholipid/cholesterol/gamma-HCH transport system substrate-binding protein